MAHDVDKTFHITGLVVDPLTHRGVQWVRVEAWDKDLLIDDFVGSALTDSEGKFQIRFDDGFFREVCVDRRPDLFFKVFRDGELLASTEGSVLWNAKAGEVPISIPVILPGDNGAGYGEPGGGGTSESPAFVHGRVLGPGNLGIPGLRVEADDVGVGGDVALGEAVTGADGAYRITYDAATVTRREKDRPDLRVRVSAAGEGLAASPVIYGAGRDQAVDVVLAPGQVRQPPEYERLGTALGALLGANGELGPRLAGLREDDERQELTYLAAKTGWDARMVAMASLAARFAAEWGVGAEYFYALFRAGVPANEAALGRLAPDTVHALWEQAAAQGVIPAADGDGIDAALARFRERAAGGLLDAPSDAGGSTLGELLGTSLGHDETAKRRFAELYQVHRADPDALWTAVESELGQPAAARLQLDGKLAFLTLNNAPLLERIHQEHAPTAPTDLVRSGLHRADAWLPLLRDVAIPADVPGEGDEEKRANYAALMADQLRLSYPTAVVAEQVRGGELSLRAEPAVAAEVHRFLADPATGFDLGRHPVEAWVRENEVELSPEALGQVKRLQRVYQITPSDEAMQGLLEHGLDSARAVVQLDERAFVERYGPALGGEGQARETYLKAHQVHHAVLSLATAYLLRGGAPALHAITPAAGGGGVLGAAGASGSAATPGAGSSSGVLPYPTLEGLFGEMDYCACDHCRSVLGPAAYLVDLLKFLDPNPGVPALTPTPYDVLTARRPDLAELPLTCENTNTALPYIDLVNEVLEFLVVHGSLQGTPAFSGHGGGGVASADLLANPQFTDAGAYALLRQKVFPLALPFDQPLEALRLYFAHFDVPLHRAMERLRMDDALDRTGPAGGPGYAWRDILMERLGVSREEHRVLTDNAIPLADLYGTAPAITAPGDVVKVVSPAREISRLLGLSYEELVELVRTTFVNPESWLIPRLERLGLNMGQIAQVKAGTLNPAPLLPPGLDPAAYGGNVQQWIVHHHGRIMELVVLSDPTGANDPCSFATLELRHAKPDFASNRLAPLELLRLHRFARLRRRLGWSLRDTDRAVHALWPAALLPDPQDSDAQALNRLDAGFAALLMRLGHLCRVMDALELKPAKDLLPLLACWAPIDTLHPDSLYRRMFLTPAVLRLDPAFQDNGYGTWLADPNETMAKHREALRAAFGMTAEEVDLVLQRLGDSPSTPLPLTLDNASALFRHGWLARKLRLGVRELLGLMDLSGLDPFAGLDPAVPDPTLTWPRGTAEPHIFPFIELARLVRDSGIKVSTLLFLLRHDDPGGKAQPTRRAVLDFALAVRGDLAAIDRDLGSAQAPTVQSARAQTALVYGAEAATTFFGLLDGTAVYSVPYGHVAHELGAGYAKKTDRIAYDAFEKRLSYRGRMTPAMKADLLAAAGADQDLKDADQVALAAGAAAAAAAAAAGKLPPSSPPLPSVVFADALGRLVTRSGAFFESHPGLGPVLAAFEASQQTVEDWLPHLVASFLPELRGKLKRRQVWQTVAAQLGAEPAVAAVLLEDDTILQAFDDANGAVVADFLALGAGGVSARYYHAGSVAGSPHVVRTDASIDFHPGAGAQIPVAPTLSPTSSAVWSGYLEAPDTAFYSFRIEVDAGAGATLSIDGHPVALQALSGGGGFESHDPVELDAGRLYALELAVTKVKDRAVLKWEARGLARAVVPAARLCPAERVDHFTATYLRLGKALALAGELRLSAAEVELAAAHFGPSKWLQRLPVQPSPPAADTHKLTGAVAALLRYAALKAERKVGDDALARALEAAAGTPGDGGAELARVAGWSPADRDTLLKRFGLTLAGLRRPGDLLRLHRALALTRSLGVSAAVLAPSTATQPGAVTNQPGAATVAALQAALRARYDEGAWRAVLRPINDRLRALQRDALVEAVLQAMRVAHPEVDTPDKLYEHLLIDVAMEPCMVTSRVRQAIETVQHFIQRCLLNLEPGVKASAIDASRWAWMCRYRVWEANRKVFLYPENWLEPALRDDKSPLFRQLESELLQGDITDDAAAAALANYLTGLEEVAMLEVCGVFLAENGAGGTDDVLHVVARTTGAKRLYYHRLFASGAWTPWEKIGVAVEDNPVLPVVWRGRLFLFWVGVQQKMPEAPGLPLHDKKASLTGLTGADIKTDTRVAVVVTLHWSECVRGKWQPARTSDLARPASLEHHLFVPVDKPATGTIPVREVEFDGTGPGAFDRARLGLRSSQDASGTLTIHLHYDEPPGVMDRSERFVLYNTNSLPTRGKDLPAGSKWLTPSGWSRTLGVNPGSPGFSIAIPGGNILDRVLGKAHLHDVVEPLHPMSSPLASPFFFQDRRHAFLVRPGRDLTTMSSWSLFGQEIGAQVTASASISEVATGSPGGIVQVLDTTAGFAFGQRVVGAAGSAAIGADPE